MWWQKQNCLMLMVVLILNLSVFFLEAVPKGNAVQAGRLIIGSSSATNEPKDDLVKKVHEHAGDANGYQSDQPELTEGSKLAKLMQRRWSPSVWCDSDSMTLQIQGNQVPNFLVETSEEGLVPLSQMPSHCGVLLRRAHRDVALTAKYAGCNVAQQGNSYILPLRVSGVAVKMVCPVACPLTVSCSPSAMVVNLGVSTAAVRLKVNGVWQPVYQASTCGFTLEVVGGGLTLTAPYASNCWQFEGAKMLLSVQYMDRELTLSCPAVQPPATTPLPAHMDPGASTDAPMTTLATTVAPASAGQLPLYPWLSGMYYPSGYGMPWNFPYGHPGTPPVTQTTTTTPATTSTPAAATTSTPAAATTSTPAAATTSTPAATVALASAGQLPLYPWLSGMYYPSGYGMPWNFPYSQPGTPPVTQTTTATRTTTVAPASADQPLLYPWLPGMYKPYVPMGSPGAPVSGPNSGVKQQMYQMPWMNAFPQVPGLKSTARLSSG